MSRYLSPLLIGLVILAVLAGSAYVYVKIFRSVPNLPEHELPRVSTQPKGGMAPVETPPPPELPGLEESDDFVRALVTQLSAHPELASWLVNENLARRFVTSVDNVARGESPRAQLPFIKIKGNFKAEKKNGKRVVASRSFRRYDFLTSIVTSIDTAGSVSLFRDLAPLFEEAYGELGHPDSFEDTLLAALERLIAVEVPEGPIEVSRRLQAYGYADPKFEALGPVEKHLLRMGPDNAREIQAKLLTLKTALTLNKSGA